MSAVQPEKHDVHGLFATIWFTCKALTYPTPANFTMLNDMHAFCQTCLALLLVVGMHCMPEHQLCMHGLPSLDLFCALVQADHWRQFDRRH